MMGMNESIDTRNKKGDGIYELMCSYIAPSIV